MIGTMAMPADFKYREGFLAGYPEHQWYDSFRLKHPSMDCEKRAKIFSPFDALNGFGDAVSSKEVLYEFRREPDEGEKEDLNRRLTILRSLTSSRSLARRNRVPVTVTYYVPCSDRDSFAYGYLGRYVKASGVVWKVDTELSHTIMIDSLEIRFSDIIAVESEYTVDGANIFADPGVIDP